MLRFALGATLLVAIIAGCDVLGVPVDGGCTLIGCDSQVIFELDADLESGGTYEIEACIDGTCESATVRVPSRVGAASGAGVVGPFVIDPTRDVVAFVLPEGDYDGTHAVSLNLAGEDLEPIEADTEFDRSQPNGPNCEPICWQAIIQG